MGYHPRAGSASIAGRMIRQPTRVEVIMQQNAPKTTNRPRALPILVAVAATLIGGGVRAADCPPRA
jgi:hypothetical protein